MNKLFEYVQIALFFAFFPALYAQNSNGVIKYTVATDWRQMMETNKSLSQESKDRSAYVWGKNSEYKSYAELKFNTIASRYEKLRDENNERWSRADDHVYILYRNREENKMFDYQTFLEKSYGIEDTLVCQNWKIRNSMKEVAGHICIDAFYYDSIKEKEVVAWFALDMPISIGPDIYCGLPGIILEVNEGNGAKVYTATSLILSEEEIPISKPECKKKTKMITYSQFKEMIRKQVTDSNKLGRPYFWVIDY
ncbi:MAG: GLPGLI family protein [Bacteroidales bacterium]|jgi:GLPGLI family protein|nr:GLPGLI family protein [Bacteroidales bacterium]